MTVVQQKPKVIAPKELRRLHYPLPESWEKAAGLLRHKRKALEQHLKFIRNEWGHHSPQA